MSPSKFAPAGIVKARIDARIARTREILEASLITIKQTQQIMDESHTLIKYCEKRYRLGGRISEELFIEP
jgi:hypothetical protein